MRHHVEFPSDSPPLDDVSRRHLRHTFFRLRVMVCEWERNCQPDGVGILRYSQLRRALKRIAPNESIEDFAIHLLNLQLCRHGVTFGVEKWMTYNVVTCRITHRLLQEAEDLIALLSERPWLPCDVR